MAAQECPAAGPGEFHQIAIDLTEDATSVRCVEFGCGFCEDTGAACAVTHAADHTMSTGHTVVERHVLVSVIRECA